MANWKSASSQMKRLEAISVDRWHFFFIFMPHASQIWNGALPLKAFSCFWDSQIHSHAEITLDNEGAIFTEDARSRLPRRALSLNTRVLDIKKNASLNS